jgi:glycosyltransferase involved in cell wall biosynthesis
MQQLENVDWLDGKIRLMRDPTDAELAALYRGCQFTVFPSLFEDEGWGLPVSESPERGRPCPASNCTSLPEAGGELARYFDPENTEDAYRTIRAVIEDPEGLEEGSARVLPRVMGPHRGGSPGWLCARRPTSPTRCWLETGDEGADAIDAVDRQPP